MRSPRSLFFSATLPRLISPIRDLRPPPPLHSSSTNHPSFQDTNDYTHHSPGPRNDAQQDLGMRAAGAPHSTAHEPLIAANGRSSRDYLPSPSAYDDYDDTTDIDALGSSDDHVDESKIKAPGLFIWALTFAAGVSGLLFGYE